MNGKRARSASVVQVVGPDAGRVEGVPVVRHVRVDPAYDVAQPLELERLELVASDGRDLTGHPVRLGDAQRVRSSTSRSTAKWRSAPASSYIDVSAIE